MSNPTGINQYTKGGRGRSKTSKARKMSRQDTPAEIAAQIRRGQARQMAMHLGGAAKRGHF